MAKCDICGEFVIDEDSSECEVCGNFFCERCAENEITYQGDAPDNFQSVCKECMADKFDGGR